MYPLERKALFKKIRYQIAGQAHGEVLEIGSGTGANFEYYTNVSLTALEPSPVMREQAAVKAEKASVPIRLLDGQAEHIPSSDHAFDTVVATLVLCSVTDPRKAVQEIKRVLKPGGSLLMFEHIRLDHRVLGPVQDALTPVWSKLCDGCHLNRDPVSILREEGFVILEERFELNRLFVVVHAQN